MDQSDLKYIRIPYPHAKDLQLKITIPVCSLVIAPGIGNAWVTGRYSDPKEVAPLSVTQSGEVVKIVAIGAFAYRTPTRFLPDMRLSFGRSHPFSLSISAGDLTNHFDFGGIPLSSLELEYGGGEQFIDFSYPNPNPMTRMKIRADGGPVRIENLANSNAAEIILKGEATLYQLNFSGELRQNTELHYGPSITSAEVSIPNGMAVKIISADPPVSNRTDDFSFAEKAYWNIEAGEHKTPLLSIHYPAGYGPLKVKYV